MKRTHAGGPEFGLVEWFRPGEYGRVENVLALCPADWCTSGGDDWSPSRSAKAYADFIDVKFTRFGSLFEWIGLWNRPDHPAQWDAHMDPGLRTFTEVVGGAAYWIRQRGEKTVLPSVPPTEIAYIDAAGIQGFPRNSEYGWKSWDIDVEAVRKRLCGFKSNLEILDECDYHYGMLRADGSPKLLNRIGSEDGTGAANASARFVARNGGTKNETRVVITGGAGFIGTNLAARYLTDGADVTIYDDLSRPGVEENVAWLHSKFGRSVHLEKADVRDAVRLKTVIAKAERVFHFAAQVAVTTSLLEPRHDYEVNTGGTLNVLEAIRACEIPPPLVFTSTNKVYGALSDVEFEKSGTRYQPLDAALRVGISEDRPLDFHSPYGCSKGAADQYVLDYARTFGIPAVVFRMSCIYGPHQQGTEDQGWVAHFVKMAISDRAIEICGDGMQVRDLLFVDDLVEAFLLAQANIRTFSGQAFNIGGGPGNTSSLMELLDLIGHLRKSKPKLKIAPWRVGDQRYYVSDTRKFKGTTGWAPKVSVREGVERLHEWLLSNGTNLRTEQAGGAHAVLAR